MHQITSSSYQLRKNLKLKTSLPLNSDLELDFHFFDIIIGFKEGQLPVSQNFKHELAILVSPANPFIA